MSISNNITNRTKSYLIARQRSSKNSIMLKLYSAFLQYARQQIQSRIGLAIVREMIEMTLLSSITCLRPTGQSFIRDKPLHIMGKISAVTSFPTVRVCLSSWQPMTKATCHQRVTKSPSPSKWKESWTICTEILTLRSSLWTRTGTNRKDRSILHLLWNCRKGDQISNTLFSIPK